MLVWKEISRLASGSRMNVMKNVHQSVLLNEVLKYLDLKDGDIFLDATLGGGGHSREIAKKFGEKIQIIGLDLDPEALKRTETALLPFSRKFALRVANFRNLDSVLEELGQKKITKILFDLGLSSNELEESGRGFSFKKDEPLLMSFADPESAKLTARVIVNNWQEENLADILYGFGGERFSRRIAKAIVEERKKQPIETTSELVSILQKALPSFYCRSRTHFATRTFQALRMAVNDELGALDEGLRKGYEHLEVGGRMAVISFHSLEDRMVKKYFAGLAQQLLVKLISKKVIVPTEEEVKENPRSRSAKLRLIEKLK